MILLSVLFSQQTFVLMKTSWRRLLTLSSEDVFKTFSSRSIYLPYSYVFRRRLQDVLIKTNIFVLAIRLQDVFKTFSRRLAKTSSRHLQDILQRCLQDVFKTYHQVKLLIQVKDLPRSHIWEIYGQCRKFASAIKIFQVLT